MDIISDGTEPCVVALRGRFDAKECDDFGQHIDRLRDAGCLDFVVDLSEVEFIDSTALANLVSLAKWATTHNRTFEIQDPSNPVRVVLEITGIDRALTIVTASVPQS